MRHRFLGTFAVFASFFVAVDASPVCAGVIGAPSNLGGAAIAFYQLSFFPPLPTAPPPLPAPVTPPIDSRLGVSGKVTYSILSSNGPPPIFISAFGNRDPYIQYSLSITNDSDVDEFVNFFFGIPIVPTGDNSTLQTVLHVNLSNSLGDVPSITGTYDGFDTSTGIQRALLSSNGGASFDTEFGPLGDVITSPGMSDFDFFQPATNLPAATTYDYLGLLNGFVLSAGTSVEIEGFIGIGSTVPEPSTLCLSLVCFGALFVRRWFLRQQVA